VTPYNQAGLHQLVRRAGGKRRESLILAAIGLCESPVVVDGEPHADADAIGDLDLMTDVWGPSVGIWQIRTLRDDTGTGSTRDIELLTGHPVAQARAALSIRRSRGWDAWTTYVNGSYKAYLQTTLFPPAPGTYVVVYGDTLGEIAATHHIDLVDLARANRIESPYLLHIGQILVFP
jgi:Lysozyme like domain/LysM domain